MYNFTLNFFVCWLLLIDATGIQIDSDLHLPAYFVCASIEGSLIDALFIYFFIYFFYRFFDLFSLSGNTPNTRIIRLCII